MAATPGLRERKKQQTRDAIVRAAMALFGERGFDATTIADIAAAADIAPRTFFAYFPSKEAVVFDDFDEVLEDFGRRLRERPAGDSAFDALRTWALDMGGGRPVDDPAKEKRRELIRATPALDARAHANMAQFERLMAEGVAADLGVPAESLQPRMVAAAAVAALDALHNADVADMADPEGVLDDVVSFLQGGLSALQRRR